MKTIQNNLDQFTDKKVIIRCNFDVPIENGEVQDTTRIESVIPTIKALRNQNAKLILLSHQNRPEGQYKQESSLRPMVPIIEQLSGEKVEFIEYNKDYHQLSVPHTYPISLIDNLRFWAEEEDNNADFAMALAKLADCYVNEAFANCHREHASMVGIPKHLSSFAGIQVAKEIEVLTRVRNEPEEPLVVIIGGAKLETKEPLIEVFAHKASHILVGGKSAVDLRGREGLPENVHIAEVIENKKDITKNSAEEFASIIRTAKTVIWNGTMGVFEDPKYQQGTKIVADAVNTTPAFTLVGGGDTETALTELDMEDGIDFISTGGGAALTMLSEGTLVAIESLK